jgi:hypothetical protein
VGLPRRRLSNTNSPARQEETELPLLDALRHDLKRSIREATFDGRVSMARGFDLYTRADSADTVLEMDRLMAEAQGAVKDFPGAGTEITAPEVATPGADGECDAP